MRTRLGQMLVEEGRIDAAQLHSAVAHQGRWGGRIGQALVNLGMVSEQVVLRALARQLGLPFVEIGSRTVPPAVVRQVPARLLRERRVFPLALTAGRGSLVVAVSEPADLGLLDDLAFATGLPIRAVVAEPADIDRAIARHLDGASQDARRPVDLPADPGPMRLVHWKQ